MKNQSRPIPELPAARLLIVDDHKLTRAGLRSILADEPTLRVVGEAATGQEALIQCRRLHPDVVLMDMRMPDMDGLAATRAINQQQLDVRVVLITLNENPIYIREALQAGATGYVLKGATKSEIIHAVKQALRGQQVLPPDAVIETLGPKACECTAESGPVRGTQS